MGPSGGALSDVGFFLSSLSSGANWSSALTGACVFALVFCWYFTIPTAIPPGPFVLPFFGYLKCVHLDAPHLMFAKLAQKYGPVFRLYFGNRLVVVLNNFESIKEAFVDKAEIFAGRPQMHLQIVETDRLNMVLHDGDVWRTHRRFALNVMRDCGVGKMSVEPVIMEEIQRFLTELRKFEGEPRDFSQLLTLSVSNNMCVTLYGRTFAYDDPWLLYAQKHISESVMAQSAVSIFNFFPYLQKFPIVHKLMGREKLMQNRQKFKATQHEIINEQKERFVPGQRSNYIDAFLGEQMLRKQRKEDGDMFSDVALEENMSLLLTGGTETTANTLMWCILYMAAYPEVQRKVQQEIDAVIGTGRTSCYADRKLTPYTEATLLEIQRMATLFPNNVPHRNTKECEIAGYKIPKNTFILSNIWAVHNDVNLWKDPEVFRPEHFLSPDGHIINKEYLVTFSMGKRECPGKILAVIEMYLYFTSMLQAFTFETSDGSKPSLEERVGFTVAPKHFCIRARSRNADHLWGNTLQK